MRKLIYIFGLLILICCRPENNQQKISYYPSKSQFENEHFLIPINLDTTSLNFQDLVQMTPDVDYRKDVPSFEIAEGNRIKRIVPYIPVSIPMGEILVITKDSVIADKGYPIKDLENVMKRIFGTTKNSKFYNYNDWPNTARVIIDLDPNSTGKELKKILLKTTDAFDRVNNTEMDSLQLFVYFDFLRSIKIEPKKTNDNNG